MVYRFLGFGGFWFCIFFWGGGGGSVMGVIWEGGIGDVPCCLGLGLLYHFLFLLRFHYMSYAIFNITLSIYPLTHDVNGAESTHQQKWIPSNVTFRNMMFI